jgi:site-specific DNA recombinase
MTLRTGKSGRYRYYTCCTKARQGETGCRGRTIPMERLDSVVADHIEQRLLQPKRLEHILSRVLDRREDRAKRRTAHIAELRKRATEAEAKLKRLYDAIENGISDVSDPMLKARVTELKAIGDQARADAERAEGALDRLGPTITPQALKTFASQARKRMRTESGGYRRDHLRALAQRVEVDTKGPPGHPLEEVGLGPHLRGYKSWVSFFVFFDSNRPTHTNACERVVVIWRGEFGLLGRQV